MQRGALEIQKKSHESIELRPFKCLQCKCQQKNIYWKKQKQGQKKEYNNFFVKLSVSNSGLDSKWHPLELTYFVTILKTLNGTCQNSGHKRKWSNMIYVFIVSFFKVYFNSIFSHTKKDGFSTVFTGFRTNQQKMGTILNVTKGYYGQIVKISSNNYRLFFLWSIAQSFYTNLHELFCQLVNSGNFMENCWISCQVMANIKFFMTIS